MKELKDRIRRDGKIKAGNVKCSPKVGQKLCGKAILNSVLDRT